jgi:thioredoxin reductase (NADPH)
MTGIPVPDEQTQFSSRRQDDVDALAWPVFSEAALDLLRSAGEVPYPAPGELLWDAGDPYDLYLVLAGGMLLLDRRDDRVVVVIEEGDFVGELGMLMGQRAFLGGVAMEEIAVLRVRVEELRRLVEISTPRSAASAGAAR